MKSTSFDSMIMSSTSARQIRTYTPDLIDRSQLKSSELEVIGEKVSLKKNILETIQNIVRFRKSKKVLN